MCTSSCKAEKVTRNRALPCGTVGGRIALTKKPALSKAALMASAFLLSPISIG